MTVWPTFAHWKINSTAVSVSALLLLVAGVIGALYEDRLFHAEETQRVTEQAQIFAASVTAALVFNDPMTAQEYVDALKVNPELEASAVYAANGMQIAGFSRPGTAPLPRTIPVRNLSFEDGHATIVVPVRQGGADVGHVYLRAASEPPQRQLARYGGIIVLFIMAALVVAVLVATQAALTRANAVLERQTLDLADANAKLLAEIEEREKAEDALRQSQKMEAIGQLSGGIAHDFNNLLTIVRGNLQLLQRRLSQGQTDVQRYVDAAIEGLNRAASLTKRILAFSRRQPLSPKSVNLASLVTGMLELLRHSVGEHIRIETRLDNEWWTQCDANQMENVILNLAINARDAMPNGGVLTIETADQHVEKPEGMAEGIMHGDYVRLCVRDNGVGMPEEVRDRAVDPFFTTKPQGKGTGLGLSMTFGYVRQSNGAFRIDSEVGKGTTITILMPRENVEKSRETEVVNADQR